MGPETTVQTGVGQVRPRLRTIVIQRDAFGHIGQLIRALGMVVVWLVALAAFCVVVGTSLDAGGKWVFVGIVGEVAVLAWAVAGTAIVLWLGRLWGQREIKGHMRRLEWMAQRPDAARRVPHRLVELVYLRHARRVWLWRRLIRDLDRLVRQIAPGWIIVVRSDPKKHIHVPARTLDSFEPIELDDQGERSLWLFDRAWPASRIAERVLKEEDNDAPPPQPSGGQRKGWRRFWGRIEPWLRAAVGIAAILLFLHHHGFRGSRSLVWAIGVFGMIAVMAAFVPRVSTLVQRLLLGRQWWVIPGGIAWRDCRLLRTTAEEVGVIRRAASSLVVDVRGFAVGRAHGRAKVCWMDRRWGNWGYQIAALIAAAWFCDARTPTAEEVAAFTGPGAVVEGE